MAQPRRKRTTVASLLPSDVWVVHLKADTREGAIKDLVNHLAINGVIGLDREREAREAILQRDAAATAIGGGLAIPHQKNKFADRFGLVVGLSADGIDFGARDGQDVHAVFLWICPPASTPEHLALMRGLATVGKDGHDMQGLARSRDRRALLAALDEIEVERKGK